VARTLSEQEARRVWRRAAELQARAASVGPSDLPVAMTRADGLSVAEVAAAAEEAGIGSEYVQLALAEVEGSAAIGDAKPGVQALGRRLIGEPFDAIEAERTIPAGVEETWPALMRVFAGPPFGLVLSEAWGEDPRADGVLGFDVEGSATGASQFQSKLNLADIRRLLVMLRPGERASQCRVIVRAPFERRGLNLSIQAIFTAAGGTAGAGIGVGVAALASLGLAAPIVLAAAGAGVGAVGYRALYRWCVRQGRRALDQVLGALAADIQLKGAAGRAGLPPAGA